MQHVLLTFVCNLSDLSSQLFDAVQLYGSSLGRGRSCQVLLSLVLLLLFPGSLSGTQTHDCHTSHLHYTDICILKTITRSGS